MALSAPSRWMKRTRERATLLVATGRNEADIAVAYKPLMNVAWTSGVGSRIVVAASGG